MEIVFFLPHAILGDNQKVQAKRAHWYLVIDYKWTIAFIFVVVKQTLNKFITLALHKLGLQLCNSDKAKKLKTASGSRWVERERDVFFKSSDM
jgi:hypothetical protein